MSQTATRRINRKPPIIDEPDESLVELVARLGNVPLHRILQLPPPGTATEADVLKAAARSRKHLTELIDGVLVEKAMSFQASFLAVFLAELLNQFVRPRNLGIVTGEAGMVRLWAGRIRIPDVAFFSWDRLPSRKFPKKPIPDVIPDLAVEVLSPSNTAEEMALKLKDYFKAGVRLVWIIDPEKRVVDVYRSLRSSRRLTVKDTLDGNAVLPGFKLALTELFGELDRQG